MSLLSLPTSRTCLIVVYLHLVTQFSPDTDDSSSMQQVRQSRFTTNSMFQRQLSTTALGNSKRTSPTSGRLFQRQATASQIISTTSSSASSSQFQPPVNEALMTNKQRASVAMPNNSRDSSANHQLSESTSSLLNSTNIRGAPNPVSPMTRRSPQGDIIEVGSPKKTLEEQQRQQQHKKVAKNKRIISRMLSISAIHTSVTGGASSTVMGGSSNPSPAHAANLANNSLVRHNNDQSGSNNSNNNTSLDISSKTSTNDSIRQQPGETFSLDYSSSTLYSRLSLFLTSNSNLDKQACFDHSSCDQCSSSTILFNPFSFFSELHSHFTFTQEFILFQVNSSCIS